MNKKYYGIVSIAVLVLIIVSIFFINKNLALIFKANSLNKEFKTCKRNFYEIKNYYEAEKCFAKIINETDRIEYKYYHALALFNMLEFKETKNELRNIINNSSKIKNQQLLERSRHLYNFLNSLTENEIINFLKYNDLEISEENAQRLDIGHYFSDLSKVAIWQNPERITVYIGKSSESELIKKAFLIWDKALGSGINFVFVEDKQKADVTLFCVEKLDGGKLGSTKTFSKKDRISLKSYLTKAKIQIALHEPDSGNKINGTNILSTTLHEIGHALGIISHSPQKGDIMYFDSSSYKQGKSEISNRDINTVKKIYGNI